MRSPLNYRRARWAAPVVLAGALALGTWVPKVAASADAPTLPPISAAQLLAKASHHDVKAFSGTIELVANLGLPDLTAVTGASQSGHSDSAFNPLTLLSGTHQVRVWDNGTDHQRLSLPSPLAETDFVHNGKDAYVYDSATQTVTHLVPAAASSANQPQDAADSNVSAHHNGVTTPDGQVPMTPEQVAQRFLDHLDPSTSVRVASPVYVAGRAANQLELAPRAGTPGATASTVSRITMAVDSHTGAVLSVAVLSKGHAAPALKVAFKSIDMTAPAASNFAPPVGATTKTTVLGMGSGTGGHTVPHRSGGSEPTITGAPWSQVVTFGHVDLGNSAKMLDSVTTPVSGTFGSARLLSTNLVNALVFPDGRVVGGFVNPAALKAAAGG